MGDENRRTKLGDYFTLQRGTTYKSRLLGLPGPVLLGLASISRNGGFRRDSLQTYGGESPPKLLVNPGELYLSLKDVTQSADLLGAVARLPKDHAPGRLTQDTVKLEPIGTDVPVEYLYWLLRTPQYRAYCKAHATGTTNLGLAREDFLAYPTPEPTPVRQKIVGALEGFEEKIEINRRLNGTLESIVRAVFKSWFVDFDPVRAKADGRTLVLPFQVADLFPSSFENSALGQIPAGWTVGQFGDVAENSRRSVSPGDIQPSTPYIALEHMPKKCLALYDWGTSAGVESNKFAFYAGEILFGKLRPYFHKVGVAPVDGVCSTDILVIHARSDNWFGFVLGHVSSAEFVEHTNAGSTGTKMPRTNWNDMARYDLVLPPEPLARAFTDHIRPLIARIVAGIHQSRDLAGLLHSLLPKLVSDWLWLADIERIDGGKV